MASGAGAAALACMDMLIALGMKMENIFVSDIAGVVFEGRKEEMDPNKARYAKATSARTLGEIIDGADVFLFLGGQGTETRNGEEDGGQSVDPGTGQPHTGNPCPKKCDRFATMPSSPPAARITRIKSTMYCAFRSSSVARSMGATTVNEAMKLAAVNAIAELAQAEQSDVVAMAYGSTATGFGKDYLIPKPFDPRLIAKIAPAVAKAAMDSGVATSPITDWAAYKQKPTSLFITRDCSCGRCLPRRARTEARCVCRRRRRARPARRANRG